MLQIWQLQQSFGAAAIRQIVLRVFPASPCECRGVGHILAFQQIFLRRFDRLAEKDREPVDRFVATITALTP